MASAGDSFFSNIIKAAGAFMIVGALIGPAINIGTSLLTHGAHAITSGASRAALGSAFSKTAAAAVGIGAAGVGAGIAVKKVAEM